MKDALEATSADVRYAYRLLLGREADPEGLQHHCETVIKGGLGTLDLARLLMSSEEYAVYNPRAARLREVQVDGVKLFPWQGDALIGDHLLAGASYEPNVLPLFLDSLRAGFHVLDVGANVGIFSLLAANRVGADGMVYSIEPVAKNVQSLCAGIHGNRFKNVSLIPVAASDRASAVAVLRQSDSSNGIVDFNVGASEAVDFVPTQRLDFILGGVPRLDVIKLDIEGHEPIAWRGLKSLVSTHRPLVFSEFSPVAIRNHSRVEPESYIDDLLEYANGHVEVLARDGRRIRCKSALSVMREWQNANDALGLNGELHLDLLVDMTR